MKRIVSIYRNESQPFLNDLADGFILMVPKYSYVYQDDFSLDKAIAFCRENNKQTILGINRPILEKELYGIASFLEKYPNEYYYVSDLGVANLLMKKGKRERIIYDPTTLICNSLDFAVYNSFQFDAVAYSNEVPLASLFALLERSDRIFYQVYGRRIMFHSRRKLLDLYKERINLKFENKDIRIQEVNRNYNLPIVQNDIGTSIFRPYAICLLKEMNKLSNLKYAFFESFGIDDEKMQKVLTSFANNNMEEYETLNIPTQDGFAYVDSPYTKKGEAK